MARRRWFASTRRAIRLAALITRDPHLTEDVVADAFLLAFRHIGTFDATRPFAPWFHKVVATAALKALERRRRELPLVEDEASARPEPNAALGIEPITLDDTFDWVARADDRATILGALRSLHPARGPRSFSSITLASTKRRSRGR